MAARVIGCDNKSWPASPGDEGVSIQPNASYDAVPYPTVVFPQAHPGRLAAIARLHGLNPPEPATARVLEIGAGDATHAIALAAAYPRMTLHAFDLAAEPVARGRALARAAGLGNIQIEQRDILTAAKALPGQAFDYIIAHGVYAWVPGAVREAMMALIGHALSPDGVAFVSYNALPGGHIRQAMREMLLHALAGVQDRDARMQAARDFLIGFAEPADGDDAMLAAMRGQAIAMLERPDQVLFHDELGECFAPQSLEQVVAEAKRHGLRFLNDAGPKRLSDGFRFGDETAVGDETAQIVRAAQMEDYRSIRFFRQSLFVRDALIPKRRPDAKGLQSLHLSAQLTSLTDGRFMSRELEFTVSDLQLAAMLSAAASIYPARLAVGDYLSDHDRLYALFGLFDLGVVNLHADPAPFCVKPGPRPKASPLARAQVARGDESICTLNHSLLAIDDPMTRDLIGMLDGTIDRAGFVARWQKLNGNVLPVDPDIWFQQLAGQALLSA